MADHSSTRTAYVKETVPGTTPASPVFKILRTTRAGSLRTNKRLEDSEEIRADGNVADSFQLAQGVSGSYPFEMAYGPSFDDWIESVMLGTWATNVLKNARVVNSYTVEETRQAGGNAFSRFAGVMGSQFDIEVNAQQKITGSIGMMGVKETLAAAIITGATYPVVAAEPIMTAGVSIGTVTIPGVPVGGKVRSFKMSIANGLREQPYIGSIFTDGFGLGQVKVTGEALVYFSAQAIYQAILDHTRSLVSLTAGNVTAKKYRFDIPQAQLGDGEIVAGGNNDDIMVRMPFSGIYDTTSLATLTVTRAVA